MKDEWIGNIAPRCENEASKYGILKILHETTTIEA